MIRLTEKHKKWLRNRALNQIKRTRRSRIKQIGASGRRRQYHTSSVQIWQGGKFEQAHCTRAPSAAPSPLCFEKNPDDTTAFYATLRQNFFSRFDPKRTKFVVRKTPKSVPRIPGYIDFSAIEEISTAAAVIMTADYDRLKQLVGETPPAVDIFQWNGNVLTRLYQLGFFNILGHMPEVEERLIEDGPTLTMRIFRAKKADDLSPIGDALQSLGDFLLQGTSGDKKDFEPTIVNAVTAISEAITNVTQHAYPSDHDYEFKHIGSFWVAATADRETNCLTVVIYDQGATIPVTYPRLKRGEKVLRYLRRAISGADEVDYRYDGTYIRAAMRYGGSRTDEPYRGKGFPQMLELLQSTGLGKITIRSRRGWCTRETNGRYRSNFVDSSLGGTLIEWTVELPAISGLEGQ